MSLTIKLQGNKRLITLTGLCYSYMSLKPGGRLTELFNQFTSAGLHEDFPFGEHEYDVGQDDKTMHLDPNRVAWVQDHIDNPPADQSAELTEFYRQWMEIRNQIIEEDK